MISYMDEIRNDLGPSSWTAADRRLVDELLTIGSEFGDQTHHSGRVDYLIRFLVNVANHTVQEKVRHYFLILVSEGGIITVAKVGELEPYRGGVFTFQEQWVNEICSRFRVFRQQLKDLVLLC